jgi:hypothetical protein
VPPFKTYHTIRLCEAIKSLQSVREAESSVLSRIEIRLCEAIKRLLAVRCRRTNFRFLPEEPILRSIESLQTVRDAENSVLSKVEAQSSTMES